MQKELNENQIYEAIKSGEFEKHIINSNKNVAIIMSQSWCGQWMIVREWLQSLYDISNLDIYVVVYDKQEYYEDFLYFKENVLGNFEIPYIRYYIDGKLIKETNYTSKDFFLKTFKIDR